MQPRYIMIVFLKNSLTSKTPHSSPVTFVNSHLSLSYHIYHVCCLVLVVIRGSTVKIFFTVILHIKVWQWVVDSDWYRFFYIVYSGCWSCGNSWSGCDWLHQVSSTCCTATERCWLEGEYYQTSLWYGNFSPEIITFFSEIYVITKVICESLVWPVCTKHHYSLGTLIWGQFHKNFSR